MTIDEYTLIADLFGKKRSETRPAESKTSTIVGVAVSDSVNGSVRVRLNGDVTGGEDGEVVLPTEAHVLEGDVVSISLVGGTAKAPRVTGTVGGGDRIYASLVETNQLVATKADITDLTAAEGRIGTLEANALTASSAVITDLQADTAKVHDLTTAELSAATAYIGTLEAGNLTASNLLLETAKVENVEASEIEAAVGYIGDLTTGNVTAANIVADHGTVGSLSSNYAQVNMANVNNAWIENGVVKDGAITNAMINSVSANKLTAGTIDASNITVTNLNASNITAGTLNGQRIGAGSLSLDKLSEDVYTEAEVDSMLSTMQAEIDGAIETWTGTAVPTLNNSPASSWTTNAIKDTHVGDVYFVVNSQSQQNGYNYRFTKSGSTYSWQLIKDSDVTNALSRIEAAEGQITQFDSDISTLQTDTGSLATRTTSLEGRMTTAEGDIDLKVDTATFNSLSSTVDGNTASITSLSTIAENNGLTSSTNITSTVNTVSQTASGNSSKISQLITTVGANADGTNPSTDSVISRTSAVEQDLSGFKTTVSSTYATQSALSTTNGNVTAAQADATNALNRQTAYSATSSTGATTAAKAASCTNFPTLAAGATVTVRFSAANTSTGAVTLNVNSTGAKTVYVNGAATSSSNQLLWAANANVTFTYDGTYWRVDSEPRSWYGTGSVAAATAAKTAAINEIVVCKGTSVTLNMTYENTSDSATLNVTSTGAKNIYYGTTTTRPTTSNGYGWGAGSTVTLVFDGAYWRIGDTTALARLTTAEGVISTHTTSLEQTASAISAKADASDVYTKQETNGLISTEVTNRNAAITAKANEITSTVSQTYTTKTEFNGNRKGVNLYAVANESTGYLSGNGTAITAPSSTQLEVTSDWINVEGASTVTIQTWLSESKSMWLAYSFYTGKDLSTSSSRPGKSTTGTYLAYENVSVPSTAKYIRVSYRSYGIGRCKVEIDGKTAWSESPVDSNIYAAKAEIKITTDGISSEVSNKVGNNEVISKINQSAESVTIDASKVNIQGAAIFQSGGYLNQTSLNNAYDSKGSASAAQSAAISAAASDATSKANAAQAAAISAAATDATNKANAANSQEQLIYCSKASGTTSLSATTTWVTATGDTQNAWTLRRPTYSQSYPVLFVATQRKTVGGTVTCTTPQIDNTTTVIDGGNIITGSVTANKLNAADINASNSLTVGAFTSAAQSDILNSNVQIGGRNLLRGRANSSGTTNGLTYSYDAITHELHISGTNTKTDAAWSLFVYNNYLLTQALVPGEEYTLTAYGNLLDSNVYAQMNTYTTGGSQVGDWSVGLRNNRTTHTNTCRDTYDSHNLYGNLFIGIMPNVTTVDITIKFKFEKGNVATDWTPAPEDMASASDSVEYIVGTQTAATGSWTGVTRDSTLFTGKTIAYRLPYAGSGNASLQLKDASGNNVGGNIAVYSMTTRVTTHYPANSIIQMTFDGSYWRTAGWYNTDTNARYTQYYNSILAGEALANASLIGGREDGKFYQLRAGDDYFVLTAPLLWLTTALASGATNYANIYTQTYDRDLGTYYTSFAGGAINSIVYLVGTVDGNKFILNGSTSADYLTCTEPTTANGLVYIPIGRLGNQSNGKNYFNFQVSVPVQLYAYKDGAFGPVSTREAAAVQANLNAETNQRKAVYGTCGTAAGTAAKVVTCSNFSLFTGVRIAVKFTTANTAAAPTLNVNSTTAKAVWNNNAVASASNPVLWGANATLTFVYDGTQWVLEDKAPTYSVACSTAASTQAKAPAVTGALVVNGTTLNVNFSTANTYASGAVQLNLSSTGAANVYKNNAVTSTTNKLLWAANTTLTFTRVGQYWYVADSGLNKYVQHVDDNGIQVHPAASTADYALINANGMDVVKGNTSVAQFGSTARIGTEAGQNIKIDSDSIDICDGSTVKAYVDANGMTVNGKMSFRTVLYENTSGYNGTITLSDSAANYNHMRIHTKTSYGHGSVDVPNPNGKDILLLSMATDNSGITTMYFIQQSRYISGTSFSVNHSGYAWMVSRSASTTNTSVNAENYMYVTRVEAWNE